MAVKVWPSEIGVRGINWDQPVAQVVNRSWSGRQRIVAFGPAARWSASGELPPMKLAAHQAWLGFRASLQGSIHTFRLQQVWAAQHSGTPTVRINGAGQSGFALVLDGLPNSTTLLQAGQGITVPLPSGDEQLILLAAALTSNGSGQATATLRTPLRESPADNATVETLLPWGLLRMGAELSWSEAMGGIYLHSFAAGEAF